MLEAGHQVNGLAPVTAIVVPETSSGVIRLSVSSIPNGWLRAQFRIVGCRTVPNTFSDAAAASVGGETVAARVSPLGI
jgi:hypothetical protein